MSLSIRDIQQGLRSKTFSARELAQQSLALIEQANPGINAFTGVTATRMLTEAAHIDARRAAGETLPALAGVPYAVKNLFDVEGVTTLAGAKLFSTQPPATKDAFAIRQLTNAGATLAGTLNMDAYAYGFTTENSHYGATRNPRDLTRVAGGSSGGSAAAVAAGMVNFALGTDTNGSIRVPASLCGVPGLKPTFGRLSRSGSHPFVASLDHIGPLARNVEDLACVYDALQGHDVEDNWQSPHEPAATLPTFPVRGRYAVPCWRAISPPGVMLMPAPPSTRWHKLWALTRRGSCRKRSWRVQPRFCFLRQRGVTIIFLRYERMPIRLSLTPASACWQAQ